MQNVLGWIIAGTAVGAVTEDSQLTVSDKLTEDVYKESLSEGNPLAYQVLSGARGNSNLQASVAGNNAQRAQLAQALGERGLTVSPSQTNFLLVEFGDAASRIEAALVSRGIVLRPMGGYGLGECLRITIGTAAENARLLATLDEVMA